MIKREPELELLLRGDLLQLTRLDVDSLRAAMRAALRDRIPMFTRRDLADPALSLIEALAACLDVMGFYHDRIATESKLGAAQRIESVARLGAAIGFRPLPPIAAIARQLFVAARSGTVLAGTRVGSAGAVFATSAALDISPSVNRMALSPVLTLQSGARRAVIERLDDAAPRATLTALTGVADEQRGEPASLPSDELRRGAIAMLNSDHGLELCTVIASRARAVAFERGLLRSYEEGTTLARTTRVRHLRNAQPIDDSVVVFEVSELPILHRPDPAALDQLDEKHSTLEIFVFDQPPATPEDWDRAAAWSEVLDFSASKASDLHYRTFVDDRLTTYVALRRKLGFRTLLDDARLGRVYARYTPAVGTPAPRAASGEPDLAAVTLHLDGDYLTTSLVRPKLVGVELRNAATWAFTKDDMGLAQGAQIAVLGGASGATYVRTLQEVAERYLAWGTTAVPPIIDHPANEHDPIDDAFDPATAKIAPLADVAAGPFFPLSEAFYKQATPPDDHWSTKAVPGTEIPPFTAREITEDQLGNDLERIVYLHKGSTFLLLDDGAHVKPGDYLLVGRRLTERFQNRPAKVAPDSTNHFDTSRPWLTAEVVQALEVQGNLVRLKDPIAQDYYQDRWISQQALLTEIVVVPRVASVYYGDLFSQIVKLASKRTFIKATSLNAIYHEVELDDPIQKPVEFRQRLGLSGAFSELFLAVEGQVSDPLVVSWLFALAVDSRGLSTTQVTGVAALRIGGHVPAVAEGPTASAAGPVVIGVATAQDAIAARDNPDALVLVLQDAAIGWDVEVHDPGPLPAGTFRMLAQPGWFFEVADLDAREPLLVGGGKLVLFPNASDPVEHAFSWEHNAASPAPALRFADLAPSDDRPPSQPPLGVAAIPNDHTFDVASLLWTADFRLPAGLLPDATGWIASVRDGTLEVEYADSSTDLVFVIAGAALELRHVEIATRLDPLDGARAVWALPSAFGVDLTASRVSALWRFAVADDALAVLGASWRGPLAVMAAHKVLQATTLGGAPSRFVLEAALAGDITHDLRSPPGAIHALRPEAALTAVAADVWQWQGAAPFAPSERVELAAFRHGGGVVHATPWHDGGTLRLIADAFDPGQDHPQVDALIGYHPDPAENTAATFADGVTTIALTLPASWPRTSAGAEQPPAPALLGTLDTGEEIVATQGPITLANGTWTLRVAGDQTGRWSAIRLALHGPSQGTLRRVHALKITQPAWARWVPGSNLGLLFVSAALGGDPVSDLPAGARHVPVRGTVRVDEFWFASTSDAFPAPDHLSIYLSPYTTDDVAAAAATAIDANPLPDLAERLGFLGLRDAHGRWHAYPMPTGSITSQGIAELPVAAPDVFPDGLADTQARVAYDYTPHVAAPSSTGLALHLGLESSPQLAPATVGTNRVVFHSEAFESAVRAAAVRTGQIIDIAIDPHLVFLPPHVPAGHPPHTRVSFGYGWDDLPSSAIVRGPLLELAALPGSAVQLAAGDELQFLDAAGAPHDATITGVTPSGAYEVDAGEAPAKVRLRGLRTHLQSFDIDASFAPPAGPHEPWLLTLGDGQAHTGTIADTLVFHGGARSLPDNRLRFTLADRGLLDTLAHNPVLRLYTNQSTQLDQGLYDGTLIARSGANNFLQATVPDDIKVLLASENAPSFPLRTGSGPQVLLASRVRATPLAAPAHYFVTGTGNITSQQVAIPVLSQSIVFPSGDFIPVTGTLQDRDDKIIRNALRVWLLDDKTKEQRLITYDPRLSRIVELLDTSTSWNDVVTALANEHIDGLRADDPDILLYSFNKALGGAFTLNFLLIGAALGSLEDGKAAREVRVYVEYSADRLSEDADAPDPHGRIYQFETPLLRLEPSTQLVVLDKGELKPDDYLFLHAAQQPLITWTRVQSITGVVIAVDPPLPFVIRDFRSYALRGISKPPRPTALDKDYYAQAHDADLSNPDAPTHPRPLVLGDRLVLDPDDGRGLLAAIIPGDRLLIWDEGRRVAWHNHRVGGDDAGWNDWPDYQHEAVVKQIDPATGLVVLTEPLPERFQVAFELHPDPTTQPPPYILEPRWYNAATTPPELAVRVLPNYRAPFQGPRRMLSLGSGDRSRRFARYVGELDDPGLGTIPLADDGVFASNIEVLARDPRSGEWSRWTQFADLDTAAKKDRAVMIGVDAARIGTTQPVPFSASFGDGIHGQVLPTGTRNVFARVTAIGGRLDHVARRRALRILDARADQPVPLEVPPFANAAARNLWLLVETGAPELWSPAGAREPWQPAMVIDASQAGQVRRWRERSRDDLLRGSDGFLVQGVRPGVVEVFFFTPEPLALDLTTTRAWELSDARQWVLDAAFYTDLESQDLTRLPGARRVQLLETDSLAPGSLLALSQGAAGPLADRVAGPTEMLRIATVEAETWSATLEAPLERSYALAEAFLRGNVVDVVQGNIERVVLGSGDGASLDLRLAVFTRAALLYVLRDGDTDPQPAIDVRIDDIPWTRVADLDRAGPRDRVYRVDREADGRVFVAFGDGVHGAVPGPGNSNIVAVARTGDGDAGNVAIDAVSKLLDANLAVKSTTNVTEGTGGRRGDSADQARETLLRRGVGLDRIVSIEDVSQVALEVGEVLHARVDPTAPLVRLVVALVGRRPLSETIRDALTRRVTDLLPATSGATVQVDGAQQLPVHVVVQFTTAAGYVQSEVLGALRRALGSGPDGMFAEQRCPIAQPLRLGDLYEAVFSVAGVSSAQVLWLSTAKPPASPAGPVPDSLDPGSDGVIRCDSDSADPDGVRGTVTLSPRGGAA